MWTANEILKWIGVALQFIGYVAGFISIFWKKKWVTNATLFVTFGAFVMTTVASVGISREAAQKVAYANRRASEANQKAESATLAAAKLGLSQRTLHDFVADQERRNGAAVEELKRSAAGLDKARNDALAAAKESRNVLAIMQDNAEQDRKLRQKMERATAIRDLTLAQKTAMENALSKYPVAQVKTIPVWSTKEVLSLTAQINAVIIGAFVKRGVIGKELPPSGDPPLLPLPPQNELWRNSGVTIEYPSENLFGKNFANEMARLLNSYGAEARVAEVRNTWKKDKYHPDPHAASAAFVTVWIGEVPQ